MANVNINIQADEDVGVYPFKRKRFKKEDGGGMALLFNDGLDYIDGLNLKAEEYRVLHKMMRFMEFENWIPVSQTRLAEELKMNQPNVARALKRLVSYGVIHKFPDPNDKRKCLYRMNEDIVWKGTKKEWDNTRDESAKEKIYNKRKKVRLDSGKIAFEIEGDFKCNIAELPEKMQAQIIRMIIESDALHKISLNELKEKKGIFLDMDTENNLSERKELSIKLKLGKYRTPAFVFKQNGKIMEFPESELEIVLNPSGLTKEQEEGVLPY